MRSAWLGRTRHRKIYPATQSLFVPMEAPTLSMGNWAFGPWPRCFARPPPPPQRPTTTTTTTTASLQELGISSDENTALTPGTLFKTLYPDIVAPAAVGTILKWCDAARSDYFGKLGAMKALRWLELGSVMRSNAIEFLVPLAKWSEKVCCKTGVHVRPHLQRLGRTSFAFRFTVSAEDGEPLARVESVLVSIDRRDPTKPVPVPNAESLKPLLRPALVPPVHVAPASSSSRPPAAFVWKTVVRKSDCHALEHINNAVYGQLIEDARGAAALAGALPPDLANAEDAKGFPRAALIEYMGQPGEGDVLNVAVWGDAETGVVYFEIFMDDGSVVTKATIATGDHTLSSSSNFVGSSLARPAVSKL
mmetsp:Transcript_37737/g.79857  ORF Transcript_37737/g.79857 Transcript_37737/m.79857 type:complete len:363 (+) Transcript_37737:238-1326(+)